MCATITYYIILMWKEIRTAVTGRHLSSCHSIVSVSKDHYYVNNSSFELRRSQRRTDKWSAFPHSRSPIVGYDCPILARVCPSNHRSNLTYILSKCIPHHFSICQTPPGDAIGDWSLFWYFAETWSIRKWDRAAQGVVFSSSSWRSSYSKTSYFHLHPFKKKCRL